MMNFTSNYGDSTTSTKITDLTNVKLRAAKLGSKFKSTLPEQPTRGKIEGSEQNLTESSIIINSFLEENSLEKLKPSKKNSSANDSHAASKSSFDMPNTDIPPTQCQT